MIHMGRSTTLKEGAVSKGGGNIQRRVLAIFERGAGGLFSTFDLAIKVYDVRRDADGDYPLTDAQQSSVRRALRALAKRGMVSGRRGWHDQRERWATPARWAEYDERARALASPPHP